MIRMYGFSVLPEKCGLEEPGIKQLTFRLQLTLPPEPQPPVKPLNIENELQ